MKKFLFVFLGIPLILGSFFAVSTIFAQSLPGYPAQEQEAIKSFISNISVNTDNSIDVVETITYNSGPTEHHGIYRGIFPYSSTGTKISIQNISVVDLSGIPYQYQISTSSDNIQIKIGDPNLTFLGEKTYIIRYHATKAVAQLKDYDEIYWNVTGNSWTIPILAAQAKVILPEGTNALKYACYYGLKGSNAPCGTSSQNIFSSPISLSAWEGLTVAVGFSKGIVNPYPKPSKVILFLQKYGGWFFLMLLPLLTFIIMFTYWYRRGRDPKGTGVIVPQYDVPDSLTPLEVAGIVLQKISSGHLSAEIIYLATKGYIKINQIKTKTLGIFKHTDYELIKSKDFSDVYNGFDQKLFNAIFLKPAIDSFVDPHAELKIKLSDLKNSFYMNILPIIKSAQSALITKGYYKNLGGMKKDSSSFPFIQFIIFLFAITIGFSSVLFNTSFLLIFASFFSSLVIYAIFSNFTPAKTEQGVSLKEYLLGLKMYLQIAEKDRLIFHNAPEKKPEIFEKLLPYAMVLGVADIWAKEFEGIYTTPPSWYSGSPGTAFSAIAFGHSISNFSSFTSASIGSSYGGGGSGGGGSSGGGGGGGGGGGW